MIVMAIPSRVHAIAPFCDVIVMNLDHVPLSLLWRALPPSGDPGGATIDTEKHPNMAAAITIGAQLLMLLILSFLSSIPAPIELIRKNCIFVQADPKEISIGLKKHFCISLAEEIQTISQKNSRNKSKKIKEQLILCKPIPNKELLVLRKAFLYCTWSSKMHRHCIVKKAQRALFQSRFGSLEINLFRMQIPFIYEFKFKLFHGFGMAYT